MAYSFAALDSVINRTTKPFNPLLGETWEYDDGDLKIITEQVSHHPPISAGILNISNVTISVLREQTLQVLGQLYGEDQILGKVVGDITFGAKELYSLKEQGRDLVLLAQILCVQHNFRQDVRGFLRGNTIIIKKLGVSLSDKSGVFIYIYKLGVSLCDRAIFKKKFSQFFIVFYYIYTSH